MHDPRIGRFFAVDPLAYKFPFYSPYHFSSNSVILSKELEGLESSVILNYPELTIEIQADQNGRLLVTSKQLSEIRTMYPDNARGASGSWGIRSLKPGGLWEIGCSDCGFRGSEAGYALIKLPTDQASRMEPHILPETPAEGYYDKRPVYEWKTSKGKFFGRYSGMGFGTSMIGISGGWENAVESALRSTLDNISVNINYYSGKKQSEVKIGLVQIYVEPGFDIGAVEAIANDVLGKGTWVFTTKLPKGGANVFDSWVEDFKYREQTGTDDVWVETKAAVPEKIIEVEITVDPVVIEE